SARIRGARSLRIVARHLRTLGLQDRQRGWFPADGTQGPIRPLHFHPRRRRNVDRQTRAAHRPSVIERAVAVLGGIRHFRRTMKTAVPVFLVGLSWIAATFLTLQQLFPVRPSPTQPGLEAFRGLDEVKFTLYLSLDEMIEVNVTRQTLRKPDSVELHVKRTRF